MLVCVDLLPIKRGGVNGGAKLVALDLLNGLARLSVRFVCFCNSGAFEEIRSVLSENIVVQALGSPDLISYAASAWQNDNTEIFDLLFFPFTHVSFVLPPARIISILHDLQHLDLPHHFDSSEHRERNEIFHSCITRSNIVVAISNYVKQSIKRHTRVTALPTISVVYNSPSIQLLAAQPRQSILQEFNLNKDEYFLYPANFWPHKNHLSLLTGYLLYMRDADRPLKLVFTGHKDAKTASLIIELCARFAHRNVIITGYIDGSALSCLYQNAAAMVFPSLYEGFGIPLVEAMSFAKPIATTFEAAIPEVVGRAALIFDGRKPKDIAAALKALSNDPSLKSRLVEAGHARLKQLTAQSATIPGYFAQFQAAYEMPFIYRDYAGDVDGDGWIGSSATFLCGPRDAEQLIKLDLLMPRENPIERAHIHVETSERRTGYEFSVRRGSRFSVRESFSAAGGYLKISTNATFSPSSRGGSDDTRHLSLRCRAATIVHRGVSLALTPLARLQPTIPEGEAPPDVVVFSRAQIRTRGRAFVLGSVGCDHRGEVTILFRLSDHVLRRNIIATSISADGEKTLEVSKRADMWVLKLTKLEHGDIIFVDICDVADSEVSDFAVSCDTRPLSLLLMQSKGVGAPTAYSGSLGPWRPGFSVVMPSFNQGRFIGRAIESVLSQHGLVDYYLFDSCSADETATVAGSFGNKLTFIREKDHGQSDAVNKGIQRGCGEIIAWLNSDDIYEVGAFAEVARIFAEHPDIDVVYGDAFHTDEHDRIIERYPTEEFQISKLIETCFFCQPATFFRRSLLPRFGLLREKLHYTMDYELWMRFALGGANFRRTKVVLANSRLHQETKTLGSRLKVHHEVNDMMLDCFGIVSSKWLNVYPHIFLEDHRRAYSHLDRGMVSSQVLKLATAFWAPRSS